MTEVILLTSFILIQIMINQKIYAEHLLDKMLKNGKITK